MNRFVSTAIRNGIAARCTAARAMQVIIAAMLCIAASNAGAQTPTPTPLLAPHVSTNKGCLEFGDTAEFAIGESLTVFLRVDSPNVSHVQATLFSIRDSIVTVIQLGSIPTNIPAALLAQVGQPEGIHQLILKAQSDGVTKQRTCSFRVTGFSTRTPKATSTATPTPTPTFTPNGTATPTATGGAALHPEVSTDRGCNETGQQPVYHLGELITVSFEVDSDVVPLVSATLFDILNNGFVNVFPLGILASNQLYSFTARIAPPLGIEKLKLRASAPGVPSASAFCTFTVVP
jgi:hypothetical protein